MQPAARASSAVVPQLPKSVPGGGYEEVEKCPRVKNVRAVSMELRRAVLRRVVKKVVLLCGSQRLRNRGMVVLSFSSSECCECDIKLASSASNSDGEDMIGYFLIFIFLCI